MLCGSFARKMHASRRATTQWLLLGRGRHMLCCTQSYQPGTSFPTHADVMSLSQPARWRHRALELRPASRRFSSKDGESLEAQIAAQGMRVREMKEALKKTGAPHNGDSDALKTEIDKLKDLKEKRAPAERSVRIAKAEKFREKGINPYAYTWEVTDSCTALQVAHKGLGNGEVAEGAKTSIAGVPCAHMCMES